MRRVTSPAARFASLRRGLLDWGLMLSLAAGVVLALLMVLAARSEFLRIVELKTLDVRFKIRGERAVNPAISIVFIGDDSIKAFGRWPWSWEYHALLVDALKRAGARQVMFDILFEEMPRPEDVRLFSLMARSAGNVTFCSHFESLAAEPGRNLLLGTTLKEPLRELSTAITGVGHCNARLDIDGITRRVPLVVGYQGGLYPSAALQLALRELHASTRDVRMTTDGRMLIAPPGRGAIEIPLDGAGQTLLNYGGGIEAFPAYSFSQVLQADRFPEKAAIDLTRFRGKIVIVGATFSGNTDIRPSPLSAHYPMVGTLATALDNILEERFLRELPLPFTVAVALICGILLAGMAFVFRPLVSLGIASLLGVVYLAATQIAFSRYSFILPVVTPLLTTVVVFIAVSTIRHILAEKRSRELRKMFSNYATERLVDEMVRDPSLARLGGERRELTILFADIVGFSRYSEQHPAEEVVSMLNEFLGEMADIIFRWEGTLDKFIGDSVLAFWGAPRPQQNHAELALRCAIAMSERVAELQKRWAAAGKTPFTIGIGLNTGEVIVGNIGAEGKKMEYTIIGDPVNLGARIEALTRRFHADILMTETTLQCVRSTLKAGELAHLFIKDLGLVRVRGRENSVKVFQVLSRTPGSGTGGDQLQHGTEPLDQRSR